MIYVFQDYEKITDEELTALISMLPEKRKKQAMRYRYRSGKICCTLGYLLFLYGIKNIYKLDILPNFDIANNGKPYLADFPHINFNISHCSGAVCCMFGTAPVGIDIQNRRELRPSSIRKICSVDEAERIFNAKEPELEFCKIWTIKESLSKLSGKGIFRDIRNLSTENITLKTTFMEPDLFMTACSYDAGTDFTIHKINIKDILFS